MPVSLHVAAERVRITPRGSRGIRRVCFLRQLTTKDISVHPEVKVSTATVNEWLAGSLMVTPQTLEAIAHALGEPDWDSLVKLGDELERLAETTKPEPPEAA